MLLKIVFLLFLIVSFTECTFAQEKSFEYPSSIPKASDKEKQKTDSTTNLFYEKADSLNSAFKNKLGKMDSARTRLTVKLNIIKGQLSSKSQAPRLNEVDSLHSVKRQIDSLSLRLHSSKMVYSLDSINNKIDSALVDLNQKIQTLKDKTIGKLNAMQLPESMKSKVSSLTESIEGFKIPVEGMNLQRADLNLPSLNLGNGSLNGMNDLSIPTSVPGMSGVGGLENIGASKLGGLPSVGGKVSEYTGGVKELAGVHVSDLKDLPTAAETKAADLSGIKDATGQAQSLTQYKDMADSLNDPDVLKEELVEQFQQTAINHFAGKEQQIQQAMETLSKYKTQYANAPDVSKLPKKRPNEMKGLPLIERLVPGIALQIQKKGENLMVDFNPYVGYRFTGRITAGAGWNHRVAYNTKHTFFDSKPTIYGPRIFGEYNIWKGFCPRSEVEVMNTFVPPFAKQPGVDTGNRQWVWGVFAGIKKDYRFLGRVKGTAMVMMRVYDPHHKSPYGDVVNARFGFEFPMRKKNVSIAK